jgi:hypothetical protein
VSGVLFKVQPTVKSPDAIVNVPPVAIVRFFETLLVELTDTVFGEAIVTISPHVGTVPLFQVVVAFQLPVAIEEMDIVVADCDVLFALIHEPLTALTR